jgi:lysyl-tRNA synthetase class 1
MYAPDMVKFSVKEEMPVQAATLTDIQRAFLQALSEEIEAASELTGEDYHNLVYSSQDKSSSLNARMARIMEIGADELEIKTTEMFKAIYLAVLGQQSGPKAGWFLSSMEKDFLAKRFSEAASYRP